MGELIDFAAYVECRAEKKFQPKMGTVVEGEAVVEIACEEGLCPLCGAPSVAFPDFNEPDAVQFSPENIGKYLMNTNEQQHELALKLADEAEEMETELSELAHRHGEISERLQGYDLYLENEALAALLSKLIDNPRNYAAKKEARQLLDERNE